MPLSSLKIPNLYTIACGFYGSLNEQNWICELCMFSQIWSHIHTYIHIESCELKAQVEHHHTVKNDTKLYFAIFPQQRLNYILLEVITNR